jgi:hypothetical protein
MHLTVKYFKTFRKICKKELAKMRNSPTRVKRNIIFPLCIERMSRRKTEQVS